MSSSNSTLAALDKLPTELLFMIFEKLDIKSLAKCNRVCKRFQFIVGSISFSELAVLNFPRFKQKKWFDTERKIKDEIKIHKIHEQHSVPFKLWNLRSLIFDGQLDNRRINSLLNNKKRNDFDLGTLSELKLLENLQVQAFHLDCNVKLDLPELRVFSIYMIYDTKEDFKIDLVSPKLATLKCFYGLHNLKVSNPLSVKRLQSTYDEDILNTYKEIENAEFILFSHLIIFETNLLSTLNKLKRVVWNFHGYKVCARNVDDVYNLINNLLHQKTLQKKDELQIFCKNSSMNKHIKNLDCLELFFLYYLFM